MASHAPASGSEGDNRGELRARVYSAKALLVEGDTFPHRTKLKRMGGKWNRSLRGWIFSRRSRAGQVHMTDGLIARSHRLIH